MARAGDVPTMEALAATQLLTRAFPDLKVRFVNVVDLMRLQDERAHPHGRSDAAFDALFTTDKPVVFTFHGYPTLVHRLTYRRRNHDNIHVHGFREEGTTTTPFDMAVLNEIDRFHLAIDVIDRVPRLRDVGAHVRERLTDALIEHRRYVRTVGDDLPEITAWGWGTPGGTGDDTSPG